MSVLAATRAAHHPPSLPGHGTQSFPNERVLTIRNSPMSVYHDPRFPPAPPALGVRDLMPSKSPSEAVPESVIVRRAAFRSLPRQFSVEALTK